jgi:cell division protein FtsI (penicillin-binding protein 3)
MVDRELYHRSEDTAFTPDSKSMTFPKSPLSRLQQLMAEVRSRPQSRRKSSSSAQASDRHRRRELKAKNTNFRLFGVWAILSLGALGLLTRLVVLQIVQGPDLLRRATARQTVPLRPFVPRRPIVDRQGNYLAIDVPSYTIYAHPNNFQRPGTGFLPPEQVATEVGQILGQSPAGLLRRFSTAKSGILLAKDFRADVESRIRALNINGIEIVKEERDFTRLYPHQEMVAEVVGSMNSQREGRAGIESSQASRLERNIKKYALTQTAKGSILPDRVTPDFLHNDDLRLQVTIDLKLQRAARQALQEQMKAWNALKGTVIVMDAQTGEIRALVVEPTYNPHQKYIANRDAGILRNWAVSDLYEPGSTFKPIAVAIALENKVIRPDSTFNDSGKIRVGPNTIENAEKKGYGRIDIAQILQHSSNIGMVEIIQKLKPAVFYDWLQRLGLGQKSGIDLPGEEKGSMESRQRFTSIPIAPATAAFGQGFSLTPLQLVTLTATLANGGKLVTPYVVEGLFDSEGRRYDRVNRSKPIQIFSPETTATVLKMMETVVDVGTGLNAKIPGYAIAGKTGTAQKASKSGGYLTQGKITSFVGILPVDAQRRYVVFAAVDDPKDKGSRAFGGTVAAPIVKSVMEAAIQIEGIAPTHPKTEPSPTNSN